MAQRVTPKKPRSEQLEIDIEDFTIGEIEEFEKVSGQEFREVASGQGATGSGLVCLVWLTKRRTIPSYTMDEARTVKLHQLTWTRLETANPTEAAS